MGRVYAITNQKGGVGKTTTAVNLSAALALAGKKVLLVDMDPQGNASSGVGIRPGEGERTSYDLIMGLAPCGETVRLSEIQGLSVIPATRDLAGAEVELVSDPARSTRLKSALADIVPLFDYTIMDCPPSLSLLTVNALVAAEAVIIPMQCEYYALEGLSQLLHTVHRIKRSLNPSLDVRGILLTMYDGRNNLSRQVAEEVKRHFSDKVFASVIPRNVRLSEAPSHGKPVLLYDSRSAGAVSYQEVARELLAWGGC
ncbi:ParA family protein [bacterium]|nr:MAG: ParA family protein [bacterium]